MNRQLTKLEIAKATLERIQWGEEEFLCLAAAFVSGGENDVRWAKALQPESEKLFARIDHYLGGHHTFRCFHYHNGLPTSDVAVFKARVKFMQDLIKEWENE